MMAGTLAQILAFSLSTCLIVQGMSIAGQGQRCICGERKATRFPAGRFVKLEIYPTSHRCAQKEVVITLKNGTRVCLNYYSKAIRSAIDGILRRRLLRNH
ncbi:hypothetical protein NDU88_000311 [Pleurodeles waltl]|uniref:Chemokine interleukin-8-like domain-containing protein n=1 Tax=Pleurodeles waltl TaxID=8319 RepID=A0AAV7VT41_PLEWA|nr:hypothetical protein NDU88_000311 [Pleurodeles waltl]